MPLLDELRSLACLAAMRSDLSVEASTAPGACWCFNWQTCHITVVAADMQLRPADYCRGLVLHEAAHAAVTRLQDIVPEELLHDTTVRQLFNALEDCRIETWLQQRLPGCAPWIRLYNTHLFEQVPSATDQAQNIPCAFLIGILHRWWHGHTSQNLPPLAADALEEAWPHCHAAIHCLPPITAPEAQTTLLQYQAHPVANVTQAASPSLKTHRALHPSPMEMAILMAQHEMWTHLWQHILPILQRLIDTTGHTLPAPPQSRIKVRQRTNGSASGSTFSASDQSSTSLSPPQRSPETSQNQAIGGTYRTAHHRLAHLIEPLANNLLQHLIAENRTRYRRHQARGQRLDLRMAMQFQADPRLHDRLWMRQILPQRPDPMFIVLVDTSGSMRGDNAHATFDALVLMREVCLRLGIPLGIIAFDHRIRILQNWDSHGADTQKLESVLNPTGSSTQMHKGIAAATQMLATCPYRHRYLWLLSDGLPDNPQLTRQRLQRLQRIRPHLTDLFALGLGPKTQALAALIPGAYTHLTAAALPSLVARLFQRSLQGQS